MERRARAYMTDALGPNHGLSDVEFEKAVRDAARLIERYARTFRPA